MKKYIIGFAAAAAFTAAAAPASAAVTTGGRVEALVGWDHARVSLDDFGVDDSLNSDGIVFGIGAGYDFGIGTSASMGIDIEASESTADLDFDDGTDSASLSAGRDLYAGARFTFPVSDAANVYVKAGYTNARVHADLDEDGDITSDSTNLDGIRGGVGMQFGLGTSAYVGAEYRYSNYEGGFSRHQAVATLGFRF
ncbi:MAG TPA: porin family protein [Allosphingosinicella sp.]|jgi:outer membrane immunogenic protein|nr:porin family protein [Allosphingosinicella sp.]